MRLSGKVKNRSKQLQGSQAGPGRAKRATRIACAGLGRSGTVITTRAESSLLGSEWDDRRQAAWQRVQLLGSVEGPWADEGERVQLGPRGCWTWPGRLPAYVPAGADPASHPFYSAAGQAVGCTALSSLATGLQASRGPGSRNRGD